MPETAGLFLRVSSGGQDERDQEPDEHKWVADHGYETGPTYRLHGKSASKGKHQQVLDQILDDIRAGKVQVLVVWYSARIERRGALDHFVLADLIRKAGGRIEYVKEPWLNETNAMSDVMLALAAGANKQFSDTLSMNVRKAHAAIDANGAFRGRAIYGYKVVGDNRHKTLEIIEAEAQVIRDAVEWYLEGQSLAMICRRLNEASRFPREFSYRGERGRAEWVPNNLAILFRSETICGRHHQGENVVRVPAIIPIRKWRQVQEKMDSKAYRKKARTRKDTPFLTSLLFCEHGHSLYRMNGYKEPIYYDQKCPKGQRITVPVAEADQAILDVLSEPREGALGVKTVTDPGHDWQDEIDQVAMDIQQLDPLAADWLDRVTAKQAEIARLRTLEPTQPVVHQVEITWADWKAEWDQMTMAQRREFMLAYGMRFMVKKQDGKIVITAKEGL